MFHLCILMSANVSNNQNDVSLRGIVYSQVLLQCTNITRTSMTRTKKCCTHSNFCEALKPNIPPLSLYKCCTKCSHCEGLTYTKEGDSQPSRQTSLAQYMERNKTNMSIHKDIVACRECLWISSCYSRFPQAISCIPSKLL